MKTTIYTVTELWPDSLNPASIKTHFTNEGEAYDFLQQSAAPIRALTSGDKETTETTNNQQDKG